MTVSRTDKELLRRVAAASESVGREAKGISDSSVCPGTWRLVLREDRVDSRPGEKAFFDDACARIFDGAKD